MCAEDFLAAAILVCCFVVKMVILYMYALGMVVIRTGSCGYTHLRILMVLVTLKTINVVVCSCIDR
jgi:hypothetical protein